MTPKSVVRSIQDYRPDPQFGAGWYEAETIDGVPVRWTSRRFEFEATVGEATHVELEAVLFPEAGFDSLTGRIVANDVPGISFTIWPGLNSLLLPVPGGLRGRLHFRIDTGGSWCPADKTGASDTRSLSLLVRRLAFVRFVELPRSSFRPPSSRPVPAGSKVFRGFRKIRRLLGFAWHLDDLNWQVEDLASNLDALERRLDETSALLEDRLSRLAEVDARLAAEAAEREETLRDDLARTLKGLRRD